MAVILAFGSAAVFALGTVLQQRVVMDAPEAKEASAGILFRLVQHPVWLGGIAAYGIAFGMQAAALGDGRLVVVQPILATTIVFALPLGVWLSAQKITRRDVIAAFVVTAGLALFLLLADPSGGREDAPIGQWLVAGAVLIGIATALVVAGLGRAGALRAALLGTASGLLFGLVSALTKGAVEVFQDDGAEVLLNWHLYALISVGFAGMTITQLSLQTGILPPAVATSSIFNPAASVVLGLTLFEEQVHHSTGGQDRGGDRPARDVRRDRRFGPGAPGIDGLVPEDRKQLAQDAYQAFAAGDREFYEQHLADDYTFSAPPDPLLDRDGFFERCWPGAGMGQSFDFVRMVESGEEVIVTYESRRPDGSGGRNTEVMTIGDDGKIHRTEVYFGWET